MRLSLTFTRAGFAGIIAAAIGRLVENTADNGPLTPDGLPRWTSGTQANGGFIVFDSAPADFSAPDMHVFGNHYAEVGHVSGVTTIARVV